MYKLMIVFGLAAFLMLGGCEQQPEQDRTGQQPPATTQEEQTAQQQPAQQEQQQQVTVQPGEEQPVQQPADQEQQVAGQPTQQEQQQPDQQQQIAGQEQQSGQSPDTAEFMGQAPKIEDAPETITLEAKNGNVTLSHREHAQRMDCQTCHGEGEPGPMPDFNKDKAHPLCQGCHKEQGAGPTKCADCHKKS